MADPLRPLRDKLRRLALAPETRRLLRDDLRDRLSRKNRPRPDDRSFPAVEPPFPIDAVFTWVDHRDPAWAASYEHHRRELLDGHAAHASRFEDHDELRFALRSLHDYANWFRTITIVTSGHRPAWLGEHERVRVVSHDELLPSAALPTFNSHAIESAIHRIDGLSEHFVYLNDDFFFARPQSFEQYFASDGAPRIALARGSTESVDPAIAGMYSAAHRTDELLIPLTGRRADQLVLHAPYPHRRSLIDELEGLLRTQFDDTRHRRFRHTDDVSVLASLAPWHALLTARASVSDVTNEYVSVGHITTASRLRRLQRHRLVDTFCLNWTEQTGPGWDDRIGRFLAHRFPVPGPWELDR